ncbi:ribonuclease D [Actinobacillus succinogenes]|uniref:Ribonuclease D n=1 Tax=Actinobacillus succinogenes (strain ATCC 55618 / DSM 22257 / CCUG 43843 / 130Z) TaxID=339671 RepID=A6VND0_ACTSZ|nr:ribonuclease D [Actinobacillus succinogenes]ABR74477.1 ribonuclease D [Actinobacillus succinogenes 130Z]PHI41104.1 ribonuclease D [Actinobacillus succinogenes]
MIKEIQNLPQFNLITTNSGLKTVCEQAQQKSAVALDTEFIRIRSYYPKLGLIQLYDGERVSLIDPTTITDFSPFTALLADINVIKVLHACYEDLEVFSHYFQQLPEPIMDTQVMAGFLAFPHSTGLASLIRHYLALEIDKGASRTDWLARPLSEKQLQYAAADVWYLLPLYEKMAVELAKTRWQSAVEFDCGLLLEKQRCVKEAESAYLNVPNAWRLSPVELMRLKLLAKWRQEEAVKRDLALNFVVHNESLWTVAKHAPKNTSELADLGLHPHEIRIHGKTMLKLVAQATREPEQTYPAVIRRLSEDPRYKSTLKTLRQKLKAISPPDLAPEIIAGKRDLEKLMKWVWLQDNNPNKLPDLLRNWRAEFGTELVKVLDQQQNE